MQDDEGNCGWMARQPRIISDLPLPPPLLIGISQGLGVAIKLNAPPHTESTPFAPFDMRLRVHGMQQGARTRATPTTSRSLNVTKRGEISWDVGKYLVQHHP